MFGVASAWTFMLGVVPRGLFACGLLVRFRIMQAPFIWPSHFRHISWAFHPGFFDYQSFFQKCRKLLLRFSVR